MIRTANALPVFSNHFVRKAGQVQRKTDPSRSETPTALGWALGGTRGGGRKSLCSILLSSYWPTRTADSALMMIP